MTSGKAGSNPPKEFVCEYCGNNFFRTTSRTIYHYRFCSPKCRNKSRTKAANETCQVCGTLFYPSGRGKNGKKKYCSAKCSHIAQEIVSDVATRDEIVAYIVEYFSSIGPDAIAKKFNIPRSVVQNIAYRNGVKLSRQNYYGAVHLAAKKYMVEQNPMKRKSVVAKVMSHPSHSDEKRRDRLARARQKQSKTKPTKLEIKMFSILDDLGVQYEKYPIVKPNFVVDCKIGQLIIQADGEYWHGHPRFEPLTERQLSQKKRDASQDKYLTSCGYSIERIWESEMSSDRVRDILARHNITFL